MKNLILALSVLFTFSAQARVRPGKIPSSVKEPDYSSCTWNVWMDESVASPNVQTYIQKYADILSLTETETGMTVIEAKFKAQNYGDDAAEVARTVVQNLNSISGVQTTCQVDHSNTNPRLSGGT